MDLIHLHYFYVVAKLEHMTQAAETLHIAQPSLSKTISRLEQELDVPLFERRGRNIQLTKYGLALLQHVETIEYILGDLLKKEFRQISESQEYGLSLAVDNSAYLLGWMQRFIDRHPQVSLSQNMLNPQQIVVALLQDEIDVGICHYEGNNPQIAHEVITSDEYVVAMPSTHQLADRDKLYFADVVNEPILALPSTNQFIRMVDYIFAQKNAVPNICFEGNANLLNMMFAHNRGLLFASRLMLSGYNEQNKLLEAIRIFPLEDVYCHYDLSICWRKDRELPPMAQQFISEMSGDYQQYIMALQER